MAPGNGQGRKAHAKAAPVVEALVRRIREDFLDPPAGPLPSMTALARRYGVSPLSVLRAARRLRDQGQLRFRQGSAMIPSALPEPVAAQERKPRLTAPQRLAEKLRQEIGRGELVLGAILPKLQVLARQERMSVTTVSQAYALLEAAGLAHRRGKAFSVGRRGLDTIGTVGPNRRTLLVIARNSHHWIGLFRDARAGAFPRAFASEAEKMGLRLSLAGSEGKRREAHRAVWVGWPRILKGIQELGAQYAGSLLYCRQEELREDMPWVRQLLSLGAQVAWLATADEAVTVPGAKRLLRCHCPEETALQACLSFAASRGHRQALYIGNDDGDWEIRRGESLAALAAAMVPPMRVLLGNRRYPHEKPSSEREADAQFLARYGPPAARKVLRYCREHRRELLTLHCKGILDGDDESAYGAAFAWMRHRSETMQETKEAVEPEVRRLWAAFSLLALWRNPETTLLIAPNDRQAESMLYPWLALMEWDVPGRVSVCSFDNRYTDGSFPMTTVDFGFGRLGYRALHSLLGNIPIRRNERGELRAEPQVIDRDSVAWV